MRIIVIPLKQIGDCIVALPVCESLKKTYPDAEIDIVLYDPITGIAENNPSISNIITLSRADRKHPLKYIKRRLELRKRKYDISIDTLTIYSSGTIGLLSGAKIRIGFSSNIDRTILFYNRTVPFIEYENKVTNNLNTLKALGDEIKYVRDLKVYILEEEKKRLKDRMVEKGIDFKRPVFAFQVQSKMPYKMWPLENYIEVINYCIDEYDAQIILPWGPGEEKYVKIAKEKINRDKDVFCNINTNNIRELGMMFCNCDIFIGCDGGPRHLAEAVGLPTYAIFAPSVNTLKRVWNPNTGLKFQAIEVNDILGLSLDDYIKLLKTFEKGSPEAFKYYRMITPERVIREISAMMNDLKKQNVWMH